MSPPDAPDGLGPPAPAHALQQRRRRRRRRRWLGAGLAMVAGGAGWGGFLWREKRQEPAPSDLWHLRFARPDGGELVMATLRGRPLVLNFWATWCPPCIREMPELDRFQREFGPAGWQVVGLAVDELAPVREFLARRPVGYAIGLAGFDGVALSRRLGNEGGGLPFTVLFGADGSVLRRKMGETSFEQLSTWAKAS